MLSVAAVKPQTEHKITGFYLNSDQRLSLSLKKKQTNQYQTTPCTEKADALNVIFL